MKRKMASIIMALFMLSSGVSVSAVTSPRGVVGEVSGNKASVMQPRYSYITEFDAWGDIGQTSVSGTGRAKIAAGYKGEIKLVLERNNGKGFKNFSTLKSITGTGRTISVTGSKQNLSSSYIYRIKAIINVYDNSGKLIDSDYIYIS